jgi:hypothetical protein
MEAMKALVARMTKRGIEQNDADCLAIAQMTHGILLHVGAIVDVNDTLTDMLTVAVNMLDTYVPDKTLPVDESINLGDYITGTRTMVQEFIQARQMVAH